MFDYVLVIAFSLETQLKIYNLKLAVMCLQGRSKAVAREAFA